MLVVDGAIRYLKEFQAIAGCKFDGWKPPDRGKLLVNVDASTNGSRGGHLPNKNWDFFFSLFQVLSS